MIHLPYQDINVQLDTIFGLLRRLWACLSLRRRRQFKMLLILMVVSAFAEVISLGAVLPFLGVLTAPDRVFSHPTVAAISRSVGIDSADGLLLPLTIVFVLAALAAGALRLLLLWGTNRLAFGAGADLSIEVYRRTLYQPYAVHVARNSSEVISGITNKVDGAVNMLHKLLTLFSSAVLTLAIMSALLAINLAVALTASIIFGLSYGLMTWSFHKQLQKNSNRIAREVTQVVKALQEGLGSIRDVLLDGSQKFYCDIYRRADVPLKLALGNNNFIAGGPRFVVEALGMALIAGLAYGLSTSTDGVALTLPILAAFALGAQRLLPALQQIYSSWVSIAGTQASLVDTLEALAQPLSADALLPPPAPLPLEDCIRFDAVRFRYTPEGPWILDGIDVRISKGDRVGIVGSTGSGKSTMLDLLMGLVEPTQGRILVDGQSISEGSKRAWQRTIAHVPQSIYLADSSFTENIAFGVPPEDIDIERVREAARQARIADFIERSPEGYGASVGERGVRLSGGQRQRIGIARALYKQVTVLVFDEATSALDNATEQEVMDAIEGLNRDLTIVIVAHRLTTVKRCTTILELEGGEIVAQGPYEYLLESSAGFRRMAKTLA